MLYTVYLSLVKYPSSITHRSSFEEVKLLTKFDALVHKARRKETLGFNFQILRISVGKKITVKF